MIKNPPTNAGGARDTLQQGWEGRRGEIKKKQQQRRDTGSIPGWEDPLEKQRATHSNILA